MLKPIRLVVLFLFTVFSLFSRAQSVIIQNGVYIPQDSVIRALLINSLNGFLSQKEQPNNQNAYVLKDAMPETSALLDEIKGMDVNTKLHDNSFYKCYLTNVVKLDTDNYIVHSLYWYN